MKGDMQILTWEYCQNQQMARFAMNSLKEYQCLVLETLEKKQSLFVWRADLIGVGEPEPASESSPEPEKSGTESSPETGAERPPGDHQTYNASALNDTESQEPHTESSQASM